MEKGLQSDPNLSEKYKKNWTKAHFVLLERFYGKEAILETEEELVKKISFLTKNEADKIQSQIFEKEISEQDALKSIDKIYLERQK